VINLADDHLLLVWAWHQNHAISLEALVFANLEESFVFPGLIEAMKLRAERSPSNT